MAATMNASAFFLSAAVALALVPVTAASAQDAKPPAAAVPDNLKSDEAQAGYAVGLNIGLQIKGDGGSVDAQAVLQGLKDGLSGATPALSEDQVRAAMVRLRAAVQAHREALALSAAKTNAAEGAAFMQANATKPGVVTLPSGLQYQVLTKGTGPTPKADDTVDCNYRGTLLGGAEFDSSYNRGEPASFPVGGVIKGWTEALQLMPVGSKWKLFVPSTLAYGEKGAGADIPPNATLIFEIELLSIEPKG
jgi:FKBP-type peptidyl-prolyl cis-trans isomerase